MEELIYTNELGQRIVFSISTPFVISDHEGLSGLGNELYTTKSVNQDGVSVNHKSLDVRNITLSGTIVDMVSENRLKLLGVFSPKLKGKLTYKRKELERSIECEVEQAPNINNDIYPSFFISLLCPDPYFRDITESKTEVSTEIGGFSFPWGIPLEGTELSIRTISYITNIYNPGHHETPLKIHLKAIGTVENPIITNLNTGEYIRIKRNLSDGDILEINTEFGNKRVEIIRSSGERENVFHYIDYKSSFFSIEAGDTQIKYDAEVGENNLDVRIYYTPKYLGV